MDTEATIIADSIDAITEKRITTFLLVFPFIIRSEFLTHRQFSRNGSSSRATPVDRIIKNVVENPFIPRSVGVNRKGMQATTYLKDDALLTFRKEWEKGRQRALQTALRLKQTNAHKQTINRVLEPYSYVTMLCTATEYDNFFYQRVSKDAQPEMAELAFKMLTAYMQSKPEVKKIGEWHIPFSDKHTELDPKKREHIPLLLKVSAARSARTSYVNFDGNFDLEQDIRLHDQLVEFNHWSPFEHQAVATGTYNNYGNLVGWFQYRKSFDSEIATHVDYDTLLEDYLQ